MLVLNCSSIAKQAIPILPFILLYYHVFSFPIFSKLFSLAGRHGTSLLCGTGSNFLVLLRLLSFKCNVWFLFSSIRLEDSDFLLAWYFSKEWIVASNSQLTLLSDITCCSTLSVFFLALQSIFRFSSHFSWFSWIFVCKFSFCAFSSVIFCHYFIYTPFFFVLYWIKFLYLLFFICRWTDLYFVEVGITQGFHNLLCSIFLMFQF